MKALLLTFGTCLLVLSAQAKYGGGSGKPIIDVASQKAYSIDDEWVALYEPDCRFRHCAA